MPTHSFFTKTIHHIMYQYTHFSEVNDFAEYIKNNKHNSHYILQIKDKDFCNDTICLSLIKNRAIKTVILFGTRAEAFQHILEKTNEEETRKIEILEEQGIVVKNRDIPLVISLTKNLNQSLFLTKIHAKEKNSVMFITFSFKKISSALIKHKENEFKDLITCFEE